MPEISSSPGQPNNLEIVPLYPHRDLNIVVVAELSSSTASFDLFPQVFYGMEVKRMTKSANLEVLVPAPPSAVGLSCLNVAV